jgi:hypothetical protein
MSITTDRSSKNPVKNPRRERQILAEKSRIIPGAIGWQLIKKRFQSVSA